ncbi:MAG: iron-sulfur cluster insertion protein ErpA [Cellvibrionaceae bacterium]
MATTETFIPEPLMITPSAVAKIKDLVEEEGNDALKLRVFVTGGGCSGFQYGFAFEEVTSDDDMVVEKDGIKAVIDSMSYPYLMGAEVDYEEGLQGSKFVVHNPNASSTCGCGESFSV